MIATRTEPVAPESRPYPPREWRSISKVICIGLLACLPLLAQAQDSSQNASAVIRPQAKTKQERDDFNRAYALTGGTASEAAAGDFANQYPESQLRRYLYSSAMLQYQRENNSDKMLAMGEKV